MPEPFSQEARAEQRRILVCKRDRSVEPFDLGKLRNCIRNALWAGADPSGFDTGAAKGLAEAIEGFLKRADLGGPVPSNRLLELVEVVLAQTAHTGAAAALRDHWRARDRHRRWLVVASPGGQERRYVHRRWDKGRLAEYLRRDHQLDAPASRMIAGRVEQLIFNCGLKVVTSGLVREMTASELLAWGLLPEALAVKRTRNAAEVNKIKENLDSG
jgi:hypothetical protein